MWDLVPLAHLWSMQTANLSPKYQGETFPCPALLVQISGTEHWTFWMHFMNPPLSYGHTHKLKRNLQDILLSKRRQSLCAAALQLLNVFLTTIPTWAMPSGTCLASNFQNLQSCHTRVFSQGAPEPSKTKEKATSQWLAWWRAELQKDHMVQPLHSWDSYQERPSRFFHGYNLAT